MKFIIINDYVVKLLPYLVNVFCLQVKLAAGSTDSFISVYTSPDSRRR